MRHRCRQREKDTERRGNIEPVRSALQSVYEMQQKARGHVGSALEWNWKRVERTGRARGASAACLAHRNIRVLMRWLYNAPVYTPSRTERARGGVGQSVSQSQSASRCRLCAERSSFLLVFFSFFFLISSILCDVLIQWPRRSFWSQRDSCRSCSEEDYRGSGEESERDMWSGHAANIVLEILRQGKKRSTSLGFV